MSDLSLRQYLKKVDALIDAGHHEEAKAHARHILSYYPKNRDAYLLLGRILIAQRHWEEAAEVLRRLLGADPLNPVAHQLLSQAYVQLFQLDNALFHMERALDQTPNDRQIIAALRELYSRHRGEKVEKIQLTAGAVATQYLSNHLPDQAIDILKKSSARFPERIDLKLMLALAYKANENHIEAAEAAVDVLKHLPFAVPANRIVAEFWLAHQRPSDARLSIARIEEVDPYLAQQIVTGSVDEARYTLPELDYKRLAEREMATTNPDWLRTLGGAAATPSSAEAFGDDLAWLMDDLSNHMAGAPSSQPTDTLAKVASEDTGGLEPEVLQRLEALKHASNHGTVIAAAPSSASDPSAVDSDLDSRWLEDAAVEGQPSAARTSTGLTGLLASLGAGGEDETWMREVLSGGGPTEPVAASTPDNLDFLADIDAKPPLSPHSGRISTGFTDWIVPVEAPPSSPTDSDASLEAFFNQIEQIEATEDPLDWANRASTFFDDLEYVESEEDSAVVASNTVGQLSSDMLTSADDTNDPLAWMRTAGIELDDSAINPFEAAAALDDSGPVAPAEAPQDPLAWARQSNVEVTADPDDDPLAWMKEMGLETASEAPPSDGLEAALNMQSLHTDELSNYMQSQATGERQTTMSDDPNWQDELDDFSWLEDASSAELDDLAQSSAEALDWMSDPDPAPEASTGFTSMLDRLDLTNQAEDDLSWMDKFNTDYLGGDAAQPADASANSFGFDEAVFANLDFDDALPASSTLDEPTTSGVDWFDAISVEGSSFEDVATPEEEPVAAAEFNEGTDSNEFAFVAAEDLSTDDFGFDTSQFRSVDQFGAELVTGEFDFALEEATPQDNFGFSEADLDAFGMPEAELSAEPVAGEFDFALEEATPQDNFGFSEADLDAFGASANSTFDHEDLYEPPVTTNRFDFTVGGGDLVTDQLGETLASTEEETFGFNTEALDAFTLQEEPQPTAEAMSFTADDFPSSDEDLLDWFSQEQQPAIVNQDEPDWLREIRLDHQAEGSNVDLTDETQVGHAMAALPVNDLTATRTADDDIAANAPDWLNSMVPGLDVDYENLQHDDFVEEFVVEEEARRLEGFDAVNDGYEWLDELVEEETNNMPAVSAVAPPVPLPPVPDFSRAAAQAAPAPARPVPQVTRSFLFAAPPPWLARLREMLSSKPSDDDEFADFDFDDDDLK